MAKGTPRRYANAPKTTTKIKIRKNDVVKVITGRDKGKTGRVIEVDRDRGRVVVEGVMLMKRHTRPNPARQIKGGIAERESSINVSNVMILTSGGVPTRIGLTNDGGRSRRIAKKTGEELDKK